MTPEETAELVRLRRARDLMDRDHAEPLDVPAIARSALLSHVVPTCVDMVATRPPRTMVTV